MTGAHMAQSVGGDEILSVYLFVCISIHLLVFLYACLSASALASVCKLVVTVNTEMEEVRSCMYACVCMSVCMSVYQSVCLSLSVCLSVCLTVSIYIFLFVCVWHKR